MAADEEQEEDVDEEEDEEEGEEEGEEEDKEKMQAYQSAMYGQIKLDGVVAFILDASGSMNGAKESRVKQETIDLLINLPKGVTFCMSSYGDVMRTWMDHTVGTLPQDRDSAIEWVTNSYVCDGGTEKAMPKCMTSAMCIDNLGQILLLCDGGSTDQYLSAINPLAPVNATFLSPGSSGCVPGLQSISERTGGFYTEFKCSSQRHDGY